MRKTLLITTAAAALLGCSGLAMAQTGTPGNQPGNAEHSQGMQAPKGTSGGAMSNPQHGAQTPGATSNPEHSNSQKSNSEHGAQLAPENNQRTPEERTGRTRTEEHVGQNGTDEHTGEQTGNTPNQEHMGRTQGHEDVGATNEKGGKNSERMGQNRNGNHQSVSLSEQQRTKIKSVVTHEHAARISHADFAVHVGARIPRTVHLIVLPEDIVTLVPEFRGYEYVMVGDEILIIDPDTLEIVDVIPA